jgi:hypothetical protein
LRYTLPRSRFELVLMPLSIVVVASITLAFKGLRIGIH